jgi:hypothetical protein
MNEYATEVVNQSVPAYYLLTPLAAAAYLLVGAVTTGLTSRISGNKYDNRLYSVLMVLWPIVVPVVAVIGLVHGAMSCLELATRHTFIALARKVAGDPGSGGTKA